LDSKFRAEERLNKLMEEKPEGLNTQEPQGANAVQELKTGRGYESSRWKLVYVCPPYSSLGICLRLSHFFS